MNFETVRKALEARGYTVACFETGIEAAEHIARSITGKTVGLGGSVTLREMGLYEKLACCNRVLWHWQIPEGQTAAEIRREAAAADVYISSVNGLAETGEIINIDGTCNRVSATLYGHEKVIFVVGKNKLAENFDAALHRARNIAAPKNARRLGMKTPCAVKGDRCYDCKSPDRICRALSVLWEKPKGTAFEVVLVNENLGY